MAAPRKKAAAKKRSSARKKAAGKSKSKALEKREPDPPKAAVFDAEPDAAEAEKGLNTIQKAARNWNIVCMRFEGHTVPEVAEKFEVSHRHVREMVAQYRAMNPSLRHHDPMQILDDLVDGGEAEIGLLAQIQKKAIEGKAWTAAVGASNAKTAIRRELREVLQAVDVLPEDLGDLADIEDVRLLSQKLVGVLQQFDLPLEIWQELSKALPPPAEVTGDDDNFVDAEAVPA